VLATLGAALTAERLPGETLFVPLAWCAVTGTTGWVVGSWGALLTASAGLAVLLVVAVQGLSHGT
ncbi:MAG: hypothetical protein ABEL76_16310, partial [Bradymonadaceae bacterium]